MRRGFILTSWKADVIPGVRFLLIESDQRLAIYGKVLGIQEDGYLWTFCYNHLCSAGEESKVHTSDLTLPLSTEQFRLAWHLGWPSHEYGLTRILTIPPN